MSLQDRRFVTEDVLAQFLACTLQKIAEMNKKKDEKIEKLEGYVLGHHKYMKEQTYKQQKIINMLEVVEEYINKPNLLHLLFKRVYKCFLSVGHI